MRPDGFASVNDAGVVVFVADLTGSRVTSAIVRSANGRNTILASAGEPAPGVGLPDGGPCGIVSVVTLASETIARMKSSCGLTRQSFGVRDSNREIRLLTMSLQ